MPNLPCQDTWCDQNKCSRVDHGILLSCATCRTYSLCFCPRRWERFLSQHSSGWCPAPSGSITCYINMLIHTGPAASLHWATDAGEYIKKRYSLKKHYPHNQKPETLLRGREREKKDGEKEWEWKREWINLIQHGSVWWYQARGLMTDSKFLRAL